MLNKNRIKYINSLKIKKYRTIHKQFIAEGTKIVSELLENNFDVDYVYCTQEWFDNHKNSSFNYEICSSVEISKISSLKNHQDVVAVVNFFDKEFKQDILKSELVIALDNIQDPGNLGTIIRIADWFGIRNIICSKNSVDCYNTKVIQATMGAFSRVNINYLDLKPLFLSITDIPVYGTFLEGDNIYSTNLSKNGIIIMGNEGKGISSEIEAFVTQKLFIPSFPKDKPTSESLNISVATAITCSEFRRNF